MTAYDKENIFAKILDGKVPATKIFENKWAIAILDAFPVCRGHCLVIPKIKGFTSIVDMPPRAVCDMSSALPIVAKAVKAATGADAVNIVANSGEASGQVVMHPHWHIIPRKAGDNLFTLPSGKAQISEDEATEVGDLLKKELEASKPSRPKVPLKKPRMIKMEKVKPSMSGLNARVRVVGAPNAVENKSGLWEVAIGDETGVMLLSCRKPQLDVLVVGQTLELRNFHVQVVNGRMRVAVDKWGKIAELGEDETGIDNVNTATDFSATEYVLAE